MAYMNKQGHCGFNQPEVYSPTDAVTEYLMPPSFFNVGASAKDVMFSPLSFGGRLVWMFDCKYVCSAEWKDKECLQVSSLMQLSDLSVWRGWKVKSQEITKRMRRDVTRSNWRRRVLELELWYLDLFSCETAMRQVIKGQFGHLHKHYKYSSNFALQIPFRICQMMISSLPYLCKCWHFDLLQEKTFNWLCITLPPYFHLLCLQWCSEWPIFVNSRFHKQLHQCGSSHPR